MKPSSSNVTADLPKYTFFEEIGRGGMGIVYRALDNESQEEVAIKILHPELLHDSNQIKRFHREARTQNNIKHNNIIRFIDIYEQGKILAIVMELLKGCSLKQYLHHHGPLNAAEMSYISQEIVQGLDAAHQQGIIHRDLKPSNIFLCDNGMVKVMDFGLAKSNHSHDDITDSGTSPLGSYYFMAPEQILGQPLDTRTDLYALGITLFKLATDELPFTGHGGGEFEIMDKQVRQIPPAPESIQEDISSELSNIILKLLEKTPENRYQNCAEVLQALAQLEQAVPLSLSGSKEIKHFSDLQYQPNQTVSTQASDLLHPAKELDEHVKEHTLLWVFKHDSPERPEIPPLDLVSPPAIATASLQLLRQAISNIPPLPDIWHQIQKVLHDPNAAASDLAKLVEKDPILTAHILRVCNSAAYRMVGSAPVTHIALALTRLGMGAAQDVILQMLMPDFGDQTRKDDVDALCFHAQSTALISRHLADYSQIVDGRSISLFAMLHDIGKLVILHVENDEKLDLLRAEIANGTPALKAEWDILGYTHIDAGMMLALHWKLPRSIHHFIYFHHHPSWHDVDTWPQDVQPSIMIIHLAHILLSQIQVDLDMDEAEPSIWQQPMRSHVPESQSLLYRPLHLPANDVAFYAQMKQEFKRLTLQFHGFFKQTKD